MPKCILLNNHLNIDVEGLISPCAIYKQNPRFNRKFKSYKDYKNSVEYAMLKSTMATGWDQGCEKCKIDEQTEGKSFRTTLLKEFGDTSQGIEFADISLSNHCNFSCRMCNPKTSSKWQNLIDKQSNLAKFFYNYTPKKTLHITPQQAFKNIDLTSLKRVKYLGGEPFITPELYDLIDFLSDKTNTKKIDLILTTNCSFFPSKVIDRLEKNFKNVQINLSIDGFESSCEYSRLGADWKVIDQVYKQYQKWAAGCDNIWLKIHSTINAYTVHDCEKLKQYVSDYSLYKNPEGDIEFYNLHQPSFLSVNLLPLEYKQSITNLTNKIWLQNNDNTHWDKFVNFTKLTDQASGLHIEKYIPKLAKYIK